MDLHPSISRCQRTAADFFEFSCAKLLCIKFHVILCSQIIGRQHGIGGIPFCIYRNQTVSNVGEYKACYMISAAGVFYDALRRLYGCQPVIIYRNLMKVRLRAVIKYLLTMSRHDTPVCDIYQVGPGI